MEIGASPSTLLGVFENVGPKLMRAPGLAASAMTRSERCGPGPASGRATAASRNMLRALIKFS
jgi:hypothetical protein